ncbi:Molecular chaperone IbpA, HSP20 family [Maridesulfovibrio ferrireducens]|uniref:Molecular chaperone IbpA, HSP20 family n=1 Tax=Maridesulfovibrio ferrireducens TaxID=246191 RepID=A0A1G9BWR4_9BACT|nr:Hsp20/alpha crystallin family protein [Maridesulfovibrio ferrireducens]SDK43830.1 Molecular chaperone IbpA, HSP20 family [Maridesulfovibrio ferrireducens]
MSNEIVMTDKELEKFSPATDIVETENGFYMYMDLPGVGKKDLDIDVEENVMIVKGKAATSVIEGEKYLLQEFGEGEYVRRFTVADIVDSKNIKANLKNGVLELFLPKIPEAKPRKIEVSYS